MKFKLVAGIIILSWFAYRYLILERLPYTINEHVHWITLFFGIFIWIVYIIHSLIIIKQLRAQATKVPSIFTKLIEYIYYAPPSNSPGPFN